MSSRRSTSRRLVVVLVATLLSSAGLAAVRQYDPAVVKRGAVMPPGSVAHTPAAAVAATNLVINGSFEQNGGSLTNSFTGWTVLDQAGGSGTWYAQSGTNSPVSGYTDLSPPPNGNFAAVTDQGGPGSHVMYQNVAIPGGGAVLEFDLLIANRAADFSVPASLDYNVAPNQQFRVDLTTTGSDPFDVSAGAVVQNLYKTQPGDALLTGYVHITRNIPGTGTARSVRLRFAEADNQLYIQTGVDNVVLTGGATAPGVAATVSPGRITATGPVTISWTATNSNNCVVSGGQAGSTFNVTQTPSGGSATTTVQTGANTRNDVFFVTCTGPGGTTAGNTVLAVGVPPPPPALPISDATKGLNGAAANATAGNASLSDGGRYVVFESSASNLVNGDSNGSSDVFRRDTTDGSVVRVSLDTGGSQLNAVSGEAKVSRNGRFVVFTRGTGQVAGTNGLMPKAISGGQICLRDLNGNVLTCISKSPGGATGNGASSNPVISGDGTVTAYESTATNLTSTPDGNGATKDVFAFDSKSGTTTQLSLTSGGQSAPAESSGPAISCAGTSFAFESLANLTNGTVQAGRRNIFAISPFAAKKLVSIGVGGAAANGDSRRPRITDDGRFVFFESSASNLVSGDTNNASDIFVADLSQNTIKRVSTTSTGGQGNGNSRNPRISCDGAFMTFESDATNMMPGDTNGTTDTFVLNVGSGALALYSRTPSNPTTNGPSSNGAISPDGSAVGFDTNAPNLGGAADRGVACVGTNPHANQNVTGAWYDPAQSGHGLFLDQLADGRLVAWWFTFDPSGSQAWFGGVGTISGNVGTISAVRTLGTRFIPNFVKADVQNVPIGTLNFTFSACDTGRVDFALDSVFGTGFMTLKRLSQPVGTSCTQVPATTATDAKLAAAMAAENVMPGMSPIAGFSKAIEPTQGPIAGITGAWYDPAQSGQGLFFENLGNGNLLAWWFTFGPSGGQAWFGGVGTITDGNHATINFAKTQGGRWIPNFDKTQVTNPVIGPVTVTISSCSAGVANFDFNQGFGKGSINLVPLLRAAGTICN